MCCLLLLVVPEIVNAGENQDDRRAYRIGRINVHRRQVFDGKHADWFGSFVNKFHVLTREDIIRNELLFKQGDIYSPDLLDETERNLRALGIIGDVDIVSDTVRNRRIDVSVYTHDRWTLGVKWAYKQEGGVQNMTVALKDDNFMGRGQGLSVGYNYRSDRNNPHGAELDFVERRLFGTRFGLRAKYVNSEDAKMHSLSLQRSFYEEAATWAGSVYADFGQQRFRQFKDGTLVLQDYIRRENQNAWVSFSTGDRKTKYRAGLAYIRARHASSLVPPTYFDRLDLLNVSASLSRRVYYKGKFIENFGRVEDVPLGYNVSLIVGRNFRFAGGTVSDMYFRFDGEYSLGWSKRYYLNVYTSLYGFKSGSEFKEATTELGTREPLACDRAVDTRGEDRVHQGVQLVCRAAAGPGCPDRAARIRGFCADGPAATAHSPAIPHLHPAVALDFQLRRSTLRGLRDGMGGRPAAFSATAAFHHRLRISH